MLLACCLFITGCANRNSQTLAESPAPEMLLSQVSYSSLLNLPAAAAGIKLAYGDNPLQFGHLYLPQISAQQPVPLLVFIHGGCWLNAYDIAHSNAFSQAVATTGIAVWSLEYRRVGDTGGGWPGSYDDVLAGIAHAQTSLSAYPIDLTQVVLAGHSAGGQLALLAAGHSYHHQAANKQPLLAPVKGVIGLAAITDLLSYQSDESSCQRATRQFLGGNYPQLADGYQQASPQQQPMHPLTMLLQGSDDSIVPLTQATNSGMPFQLLDNAGHFDWIHPQTEAYKHFLFTLQELLAQ
ncbi:esterase [Arsukibacterium ikkense]|uniref:Esterase n=1 Tax=Arsukibacterium ikkense TaxID=336831 RepID=A0A0M2VA27_9GAMM|nr:esterase [Arsukibacterium ikkense]